MSANWLRKSTSKLSPNWFRRIGNLWLPFLAAGIKATEVAPDFRHAKVMLKRRWYNTNYVGTQFGGSIYAMTDPFYMLMLINNLGRNYIVWDKAASIRFRKPGKTALYAEFTLSEEDLQCIRTTLQTAPKMDWLRTVIVRDTNGEVVAEVEKTIYIARKSA
jgi:hypothetical protein